MYFFLHLCIFLWQLPVQFSRSVMSQSSWPHGSFFAGGFLKERMRLSQEWFPLTSRSPKHLKSGFPRSQWQCLAKVSYENRICTRLACISDSFWCFHFRKSRGFFGLFVCVFFVLFCFVFWLFTACISFWYTEIQTWAHIINLADVLHTFTEGFIHFRLNSDDHSGRWNPCWKQPWR